MQSRLCRGGVAAEAGRPIWHSWTRREECIRRYTSNARRIAPIARSISASLFCQLHTDTRRQRFSRHVVPEKNASPDSTTLAITLSVRLPRIGLRCARQQIPMLGAGRRPQPESTIYMHPRPRFMRDRNQLGERIIGPNIDITSLQDDDGRAMAVLLQRPQEFRCFQLSLFRNRRFGAATIRAALGFP